MPRSCRNFSNSSCTVTSRVSNCSEGQTAWINTGTTGQRWYTEDTNLRTDVQAATLPVRFRRQLGANLGIGIERDVVNDERSVLAHCVDRECARTGVLDHARNIEFTVCQSHTEKGAVPS